MTARLGEMLTDTRSLTRCNTRNPGRNIRVGFRFLAIIYVFLTLSSIAGSEQTNSPVADAQTSRAPVPAWAQIWNSPLRAV
jgi:hypothetical protein